MIRRLYLLWMYKIQMVNAYLAWHREERILAAEFENDANRYASELQRLEILNEL